MLLKTQNRKSAPAFVTLVLISFVLCAAAYASQNLVRDTTITQEQIEVGIAAASSANDIPIVMNEMVLDRIYRYIATPKSRKFVRDALLRKAQYKGLIDPKLAEAQLPNSLALVPAVESGYRNFKWSIGAGLWGFIVPTAKRYGLQVNDTVDERLHEDKETDAAVKMFRDLHSEFGDWYLAIKAYNEGNSRIRALIKDHGTRDPWVLEKLSPRQHYLSDVMAMLIIAQNVKWIEN